MLRISWVFISRMENSHAHMGGAVYSVLCAYKPKV
jgi:hypothetical protein